MENIGAGASGPLWEAQGVRGLKWRRRGSARLFRAACLPRFHSNSAPAARSPVSGCLPGRKSQAAGLRRGNGDDPLIEVAHEVLITHWPVLSNWIADRREAFHLLRRLQTEAVAWELKRQTATPAKKYHRPWDPKEIDEFRARLENADMLHVATADKSLRELLTPGEKWIWAELNEDSTKPMRRWELGMQLDDVGDARGGVGVKDGTGHLMDGHPGGESRTEGRRREPRRVPRGTLQHLGVSGNLRAVPCLP
jgi:hypothetical protein